MSEEIPMLSSILDDYENNIIEAGNSARKCYLNENHKKNKIITWVHDHELNGHLLLRKMSMSSARRDLLRQPQNK
jgi:hypothetical protein